MRNQTYNLRPYQLEAINQLIAFNRDAILADEPGLGKTPTALGFASRLYLFDLLIVCPASLRLTWRREMDCWLDPSLHQNVTTVSYEGLAKVGGRTWNLIIFDEAHYLKNPKTRRTRLALSLPANRRLFLTGTPIVNRPMDLYPILASIGIKLDRIGFGKRYCGGKLVPIQWKKGRPSKYAWDFSGASNLDELNAALRKHCMVRRTKDDLLPELPPKVRTVIEIDAPHGEPESLRSAGLKYFNSLKDASETAELKKILFTEMSKARAELFARKRPYLLEILRNQLLEEEEKVIIGCYHREAVETLEADLSEYGAVKLYGGMSDRAKQKAVDEFQTGKARVFIGQIQAAGTGFDLSASACVLIAEPDWVPGNLIQFEDRPHRLTQKRMVRVVIPTLRDSIEGRMIRALVEKQETIERVMK